MGFSFAVREEVLVRSARRCCVCREYKGVKIEIHHIKQQADGGNNDLDNAIALCLDCHASAGHYNPRHPKGTRFSPAELRKHRDLHWANVAKGLLPAIPASAANLHIKHLVCLDYAMARDALAGKFYHKEFQFQNIVQNAPAKFMETVLADKLPYAQTSLVRGGLATPGFVPVTLRWSSREALAKEHPEFSNKESRPTEPRDLQNGAIESELLRRCVENGLDASELGTLDVGYTPCGAETYYLEYNLRRPIFLFTEIRNCGSSPVTLSSLTGYVENSPQPVARKVEPVSHALEPIPAPPISLRPGEAIIIPAAVLLSPAKEDDLAFEWIDNTEVDTGSIDYLAFTSPKDRVGSDQYLQVGTAFFLKEIGLVTSDGPTNVEVHLFDLSRIYIAGHGWLAGSCPYLLFELSNGAIHVVGEILSEAWGTTGTYRFIAPAAAKRFHLCEFEFETTTVEAVRINGREKIDRELRLNIGEILSFEMQTGDVIEIVGRYDATFNSPRDPAQHRSKRSLVSAGLRRAQRCLAA